MELLLLGAVLLYFVAALLFPTILAWRVNGTFPIVFHREAGWAQRIVGGGFGVLLLGLFVWAVWLPWCLPTISGFGVRPRGLGLSASVLSRGGS